MVPYARYLLRHKQLTTNDYLLSSNKVHTAAQITPLNLQNCQDKNISNTNIIKDPKDLCVNYHL